MCGIVGAIHRDSVRERVQQMCDAIEHRGPDDEGIHHDEDAEVYLDGTLALQKGGYTTEYDELPVSAEAKTKLKPGKHTLAVHCKQTRGGQYIDVGIVKIE